jgi:hypothetical protein
VQAGEQLISPAGDFKSHFEFLNDEKNWVHLGFLAADASSHSASEPITRTTVLSSNKFI